MFISTRKGEIINTRKIQKITTSSINGKYIITAIFDNGTCSDMGEFEELSDLEQYQRQLNSYISVYNPEE